MLRPKPWRRGRLDSTPACHSPPQLGPWEPGGPPLPWRHSGALHALPRFAVGTLLPFVSLVALGSRAWSACHQVHQFRASAPDTPPVPKPSCHLQLARARPPTPQCFRKHTFACRHFITLRRDRNGESNSPRVTRDSAWRVGALQPVRSTIEGHDRGGVAAESRERGGTGASPVDWREHATFHVNIIVIARPLVHTPPPSQ